MDKIVQIFVLVLFILISILLTIKILRISRNTALYNNDISPILNNDIDFSNNNSDSSSLSNISDAYNPAIILTDSVAINLDSTLDTVTTDFSNSSFDSGSSSSYDSYSSSFE